jgi:hypothetical protein
MEISSDGDRLIKKNHQTIKAQINNNKNLMEISSDENNEDRD